MSKYTTEVRFVCETLDGYEESQGYKKVTEIVNNVWNKIFDFDFPIFDESYRAVLCKKIILHYYTREIGLETVGLWQLKLMTKMNEIMPYYNQLYKSALIEFNPMYDADYTKTHEGTASGEDSHSDNRTEQNNKQKNRSESGVNYDLYSETPQGALTGVDTETYLTDARKITDSRTGNENESGNVVGNSVGQSEFNNAEQYIEHVVGKFPGTSYAKRLEEFRKTFLNIDVMVIDELKDLFMLIW